MFWVFFFDNDNGPGLFTILKKTFYVDNSDGVAAEWSPEAFRTWMDTPSPLARAYMEAWARAVKETEEKYSATALPLEELERALHLEPGAWLSCEEG